jgi:hypothetical protein
MRFRIGSKCNCFVNNVLSEVGLDPRGTRFPRAPSAEELATGSNLPPDFALVPNGNPAARGDIIAQKRAYGGATGHAAIMTSEAELIEAKSIGLKRSPRAQVFPANNPIARSPVRFVRYSPQNPWFIR